MYIDFLTSVFRASENNEAIIYKGKSFKYKWLLNNISHWQAFLKKQSIDSGTVVILQADFSPNAISLLLALIEHSCIVVPITFPAGNLYDEFIQIAQGELSLILNEDDELSIIKHSNKSDHKLYSKIKNKSHPGLVLFSSGSTGKSKATLHDFNDLLKKYRTKRQNLRTLTFLLFDHIGGVDTLFYSLSNGSCIITVNDRSPQNICATIEKFKVEVLPVSPSFMNLLLLSKAFETYDLSSLKYITYGAEIMPESTLKQCTNIFPNVKFLQKYGTTEVGTLRSQSKSSDSVWVKIGGDGFKTRIVDDILQIKADSAMMGYLNAPNPFTKDGWFITGDKVEVNGEFYKILGRESDIINVGGEKVYPSEVENVIMQFEGIADVTVYAEKNPILGNIVAASISVTNEVDKANFIRHLKKYCNSKLQNYKVPVKIYFSTKNHHTIRYKKLRHHTDIKEY